ALQGGFFICRAKITTRKAGTQANLHLQPHIKRIETPAKKIYNNKIRHIKRPRKRNERKAK
ncbi:hypothetical protein, partial [Klebsiella pneumoniae]|uniref:hypothetical protein n=1 Tax=Klebsiella pneumoniae TaxID=573 RepID=UPI001C6096F0